MKPYRVFLALLVGCLLLAQQGCLRHAMGHVLALRAQAAVGMPGVHVNLVQADAGACELCVAFAVVGGGMPGGGLLSGAAGEQVLVAAAAFDSVILPAQVAFAPRAPPQSAMV